MWDDVLWTVCTSSMSERVAPETLLYCLNLARFFVFCVMRKSLFLSKCEERQYSFYEYVLNQADWWNLRCLFVCAVSCVLCMTSIANAVPEIESCRIQVQLPHYTTHQWHGVRQRSKRIPTDPPMHARNCFLGAQLRAQASGGDKTRLEDTEPWASTQPKTRRHSSERETIVAGRLFAPHAQNQNAEQRI